MIEFSCSQCGKRLKVQDEAAGKRGKCPQCGTGLTVPDADFVTLQAADQSAPPPPPSQTRANPQPGPAPQSRPPVTGRKHRRWVIVLLVAAVIAIPFAPKFPLWLGIVVLGLCALAFVPNVSSASRWLLRLPQDRKWASGLRVAMYALIGLVLILGGFGGAQFRAEQDRIAAEQAAQEAEQRRLTAEANETVATLAREAEEHWKSGQASLAEDKLHQAERTQHATNLAPVKQLRTRMANAQVDALMQEAVDAMKKADLTLAQQKVQEALAIPNATALDEPRQLQRQIANATDPDHIKKALMELSDEAFKAFQEHRTLPTALASGYDALDAQALELAQASTDEVVAAREKRRQERIAQERAAAEAARKAEEERVRAARQAREEQERRAVPLVVKSWSWHVEHGYAIAEGEVTNRSSQRLENVQVVVSFYTEDGTFISTADAIVEYNPILPGQTTPFKALTTHNPQMKSARLGFKHLFGGSIGYAKP